jgi:hypothetical protein
MKPAPQVIAIAWCGCGVCSWPRSARSEHRVADVEGVAEAQVGGVDDADDVAGERLVEHRTGDFRARRVGRRDWGHDGPVHDFGGKGGGSMTHR